MIGRKLPIVITMILSFCGTDNFLKIFLKLNKRSSVPKKLVKDKII